VIVLNRDEPIGRLMLQIGRNSWHVIDVVLLAIRAREASGPICRGRRARCAEPGVRASSNLTVLSGNAAPPAALCAPWLHRNRSGAHIAMSNRSATDPLKDHHRGVNTALGVFQAMHNVAMMSLRGSVAERFAHRDMRAALRFR